MPWAKVDSKRIPQAVARAQTSSPTPWVLQALQQAGVAIEGLRSKSRDEFAAPKAPQMDLIITVCDHAKGEACPIWPGHPATAHWGYTAPSEGDASLKPSSKPSGRPCTCT